MIRILRPEKIPSILLKKGVDATKDNCNAFEADPKDFLTNFKPNSKVYGSKVVKRTLKKAQYGKCCFCEKDQLDEYGAVEHFRPKSGYKINNKQKELTKPGYYWLTYSWDNLLFVCGVCNTTYKQNFFPLVDETKRAKSHLSEIDLEESYLLDPCGLKDPKDHIIFTKNLPTPLDEFGTKTIKICGLDRDALNDLRAKLISNIDVRLAILSAKEKHTDEEVENATKFIIACQKPQAEFSATARDYLANFNIAYSK